MAHYAGNCLLLFSRRHGSLLEISLVVFQASRTRKDCTLQQPRTPSIRVQHDYIPRHWLTCLALTRSVTVCESVCAPQKLFPTMRYAPECRLFLLLDVLCRTVAIRSDLVCRLSAYSEFIDAWATSTGIHTEPVLYHVSLFWRACISSVLPTSLSISRTYGFGQSVSFDALCPGGVNWTAPMDGQSRCTPGKLFSV